MQCSYRDNPFYVIILRFLFQRNPNTIMNISPHVTKKAEENAADKFAERFNFWFSNEWNSKWNSLRYFRKNKKARKGFAQPFLAYIWCFILQTLPFHAETFRVNLLNLALACLSFNRYSHNPKQPVDTWKWNSKWNSLFCPSARENYHA